jgi:CheY-like chemotaxis protein
MLQAMQNEGVSAADWDHGVFVRLDTYGKLGPRYSMDEVRMTTKRIFCFDDEPDMIELLRAILEGKGFEFICADGGVEGLKVVREEKPDLILLDLMMPDMDGWEVFQQVKDDPELSKIPVVVVTAKAQSIDKVLGLYIARADDYITKPFKVQDLVDSVEKFIGNPQ